MPYTRAIPGPRLKPEPLKDQAATSNGADGKVARFRRPLIHAFLLTAIALVMTMVGVRCAFDFRSGQPPFTTSLDIFPYRWIWNHLSQLASGLPFFLTLVSILFAYELGRYLACRHFRVPFEPILLFPRKAITQSLTGDPKIVSRSALIAISAAGPVAGFAVAVATTCYGLIRSTAAGADAAPSVIRLSAPGVIDMLRATLLASFPDIPPLLQMIPHPVLVASWIGLFLTALRLIPAGRSDGGRIVYAISPYLHKASSTIVFALLLYLGTVEWVGWLFGAAMLALSTLKRPRYADPAPIGVMWLAFGPVSLAIFLLTATVQPFIGMNLVQVLFRIH